MIIDFHTHIFPKPVRLDRYRFFAGEPEFRLLYENPKSKIVGAGALIESMDRQRIDQSVVFGFPWNNPTTLRQHNDYILQAVQRYPDRLIGFCCLNPTREGAAAEAERCIDAGMAGIGELAFYGSDLGPDLLDHLDPLMQFCRAKGIPTLLHTNEPIGFEYPGKSPMTLGQIYRLGARYPENTLIFAHWGGGLFFYNLLKKEVKDNLRNVYFDTAASPFLYDQSIYRFAVSIIGREKILFGSDFPLLDPNRYLLEMEAAGLSEQDIRSISGLNAAKILNL